MINHLRTLLLNVDGAGSPAADFPGEQYVPADFRARPLAGPVMRAHRWLFGDGLDRAARNYRLQEYLTCVHACGLDRYVLSLDPRITYWPFGRTLFDRLAAGVAVTPRGTTAALYVQGGLAAAASEDRLFLRWQVDVLDAASARVLEVADATGQTRATVSAYATTAGLGGPLPLPGSGLTVTFAPVPGASWLIELLARPSRGLCQVVVGAETALAGDLPALLAGGEPFATFRGLWTDSDQLPYRAAGLVLAVGYRIQQQGDLDRAV